MITARQEREIAYHQEYAQRQKHLSATPVALDIIDSRTRRPWNAYWRSYDMLMALGLGGKRVLVPGCGFGDDAIRLSILGAEVHAFDLSPDVLEVARERAAMMNADGISFEMMPSEHLLYPDSFFDAVFFNDILHHVDIPVALQEVIRVLKPGGHVVGNELYTHAQTQRIRRHPIVDRGLYPRMVEFIYGTDRPYITIDEHKIDEREFRLLSDILTPDAAIDYFLLFTGRLFPSRWILASRIDQMLMRALKPVAPWLAGRVVFSGRVRNKERAEQR